MTPTSSDPLQQDGPFALLINAWVFEERPEAIQAAVIVAESSGRSGRASEVLAEDEGGETLRIWEVGRDAYSPLRDPVAALWPRP
jgi:hypothetical protein